MKKKVIHFIFSLNTGGAESLVKDYALGLNKDKYDVCVLAAKGRTDSPWEAVLAAAGIRIIYLHDHMPFSNKSGFLFKCINFIWRHHAAKKVLRAESPDILHTHLHVSTYVRYASLPDTVTLVHTLHNEVNVYWNKKKLRLRKELDDVKWLVKHKHMRLIALHDRMRNEINEVLGVSDTIVLNNGIDFSRFENHKEKSIVRDELSIPQDAYVIGHVGRFVDQKNHTFLCEIFEEILRRRENAFLLMVGSGVNRPAIEELLAQKHLQDRYSILENRNDVPDILHAMDAFVFPSHYEGLSVALIEAQKAELPCFISTGVEKDAAVTDLCRFISLDDGAAAWADIICNFDPDRVINKEVPPEWDMKNVCRKLEQIYEREI